MLTMISVYFPEKILYFLPLVFGQTIMSVFIFIRFRILEAYNYIHVSTCVSVC